MAGNAVDPGRSVTSKLAAILMSFTSGSGHGLTELARRTGLPTSTAHRLTAELVDRDLLERGDDGAFRPGGALRRLGGDPCGPPTVQERAPFVVEDLAESLRSSARVGLLDDLGVAYIEKAPGFVPVTTFSAAARLPVHATALGKALLAFAPDVARVAAASPLAAYTTQTITRPDRLHHALGQVRRTGFAVDRGELDPDRCAVAVPVRGPGGCVVAAVEVQVETLAAAVVTSVLPALLLAARGLGRELGAGPRAWEGPAVGQGAAAG